MNALHADPVLMNNVRIADGALVRNGEVIASISSSDPADMYRVLGFNYPKFFKMDTLSKWAWLGAEALLKKGDSWLYEGTDKQNIAVVLATADGCLEVDHRYAQTIQTIPSPALFVYTLPNIMLGEICIRHGFTGEQLCEVQEAFEPEALLTWVRDLLTKRGMTHCLAGWVDASGDNYDVSLFWTGVEDLEKLSGHQLQIIHNNTLSAQL
jgi:hypothetical protein